MDIRHLYHRNALILALEGEPGSVVQVVDELRPDLGRQEQKTDEDQADELGRPDLNFRLGGFRDRTIQWMKHGLSFPLLSQPGDQIPSPSGDSSPQPGLEYVPPTEVGGFEEERGPGASAPSETGQGIEPLAFYGLVGLARRRGL